MCKIFVTIYMIILLIMLTVVYTKIEESGLNSNKDCQKYIHYENGEQTYAYYKCIPVTPVTNN